jgi:tetratricopeptide (TPR) repeat protein
MDSGNNNSNQSNKLSALSNTSIQSLSNQIRFLDDLLQERNPEYWFNKAVVCKEDKNWTQCVYFLDRTLLLKTTHINSYLLRALCHLEMNRGGECINDIVKYFQINYVDGVVKGNIDNRGRSYERSHSYFLTTGINNESISKNELKKMSSFLRPLGFSVHSKLATILIEMSIAIQDGWTKDIIQYTNSCIELCVEIINNPENKEIQKWAHLVTGIVLNGRESYINKSLIERLSPSSIKNFDAAILIDNSFAPALFEKALLLHQTGEYNTCEEILSMLKGLTNQEYLNLFLAKYYSNEDKARELFEAMIESEKSNKYVKGMSYVGLAYFMKKKYDSGSGYYEAYPLFKKAEDLDIILIHDTYSGIAWKMKKHGNLELAIEYYFKAAIADPSSTAHIWEFTELMKSVGRIDEAIKRCELYVKNISAKDTGFALRIIGELMAEKNVQFEAIKYYTSALEVFRDNNPSDPNIPYILNLRGKAYQVVSEFQKADKDFKESEKLATIK